jgi:hypothetical protein
MATEESDERFQTIPSLPKGVEVSERTQDLYDTLREKYDNRPPGNPERDEYGRAIRALVKRVVEEADPSRAGVEAEFVESPTNTRTEFHDRRGRIAVRETDGYGNVRTTTTTKEQTRQYEDRLKARLAERDAAAWDGERAKNLRSLAHAASDAGSTSVFNQLMEEASALEEQRKAKLDKLRAEIPEEEWGEYNLGEPPAPFLPGVEEALSALHAGRTTDVYEMTRDFGQAEMYQLRTRLPKEDEKFFEVLLKQAGDEETKRRQRVGF